MSTSWVANGRDLLEREGPGRRPLVMGIVNATPDSFSDGGRHFSTEAAVAHGIELARQGAGLIDVGGESSRPGATLVPLVEELERTVPVVAELVARRSVPISIDTAKPEVARACLRAGAAVVNDIGGLRDPEMVETLARWPNAGVVLMHMAGTPQTMQVDPEYFDVVAEVYEHLARQVERAVAAGIARNRIAIDPGIGFGKRSEHNKALLKELGEFRAIGCAIVIGTSRKSWLGALTGRKVEERLVPSVVSALACALNGADVVRVHDVGATNDGLAVWEAIRGWT